MAFDSIASIIEDLRQGRMVIIVDDEDRENEGDLVMAAEKVRPEDINFMVKEARGLLCLPVTAERAAALGLQPMVQANQSPYHTNFTISIEAAEGVTTGISVADRARTIQAAVARNARAEDLVQPGHIFPLIARPGGVLQRAGHTEAGCDLVGLAGLEPAAALIEILRDDGEMARRPELEQFARQHGLKIGSIEALIRYRLDTEVLVDRLQSSVVETAHGAFQRVVYRDRIDGGLHDVLYLGTPDLMDPGEHPVIVPVAGLEARGDLELSACAAELAAIRQAGRGLLVRISAFDGQDTERRRWDRRELVPQLLRDLLPRSAVELRAAV
ncbi:3,4-dihydroxy-2-butanone-4-phosphate synthase [Frateuria aurantia]